MDLRQRRTSSPPTGIGLSLAAGPVSGGGFFGSMGPGEFAGGLSEDPRHRRLRYGVYRSFRRRPVRRRADRHPAAPPGIQLGFGFAVSGFGGLVGINRRADTDLLRERLASGAAGNVLFNDNPMKNAPSLLGDMARFFPDEAGVFLIGPTLQVNWLYIVKLDLGIFIELPGPRKIFLAGSARLVLGSEEFALVYLRMDFVGRRPDQVAGLLRRRTGELPRPGHLPDHRRGRAADLLRRQRLLPVHRRRLPPAFTPAARGCRRSRGSAWRSPSARSGSAGDVLRDHLQHLPARLAHRGRASTSARFPCTAGSASTR